MTASVGTRAGASAAWPFGSISWTAPRAGWMAACTAKSYALTTSMALIDQSNNAAVDPDRSVAELGHGWLEWLTKTTVLPPRQISRIRPMHLLTK